MVKRNVKKEGDKRLKSIETTLSKTELFIVDHQKPILIVLAVIIGLVLVVLSVKKFYMEPREKEAQTSIFRAEQYFEKDDFDKALNGDGNNLGFLDIVNDFGGTKIANLAKYYAGICYLNTGDYEQAIHYLKSFKGKDQLVASMAIGAIGDAYMELGNLAEASKYYEQAAFDSKNTFTSPMHMLRAGMTHEMNGNYQKAIEIYQKIKADYPTSNEAFSIEKYIARAKAEMEN